MKEKIIEKARELYRKYGNDDLEYIASKLGATIFEYPLGKTIKEVYFHDLKAIVVDPNLHPYEKKYLICHALAHHLFHRGIKVNYFIDENKNFFEGVKIRKMEKEAETFAAYFLIPEERLNEILKEEWINESLDPIPELAEEFQVPNELIKKRLEVKSYINKSDIMQK